MNALQRLGMAFCIAGVGAVAPIGGRIPSVQAAEQGATDPWFEASWKEYQDLKAKAHGGTRYTRVTAPDWSGIWQRRSPAGGGASFGEQVMHPVIKFGHGLADAPLNEKYRKDYEAKVARAVEKGLEFDRQSLCLPLGMPAWIAGVWPIEFLVTPDQTWMIQQQGQEIRRIYTDGRGHVDPKVAVPQWEGDSVGFWDGDTLVIHTQNVKAGEYARLQPSYSFRTSVVEQVRKVSEDEIQIHATVYDPASLTRPYKAVFYYDRMKDPDLRLSYMSCEEGNNAVVTPDGGTTNVFPGEPGYRDATTYGIPAITLDTLPQ